MSHKLILPGDFQKIMKDILGSEYNLFLDSLQTPSPVSIRINPKKNNSLIKSSKIPWTRLGYYLESRPVFTLDPFLHAGAYYVQEPSSMFLEQAVKNSIDLTKPIVALDLCAAPGGKSTHLLSLLSSESLLISNEAIKSRASILGENIQKWGHANVMVTNNDPSDFTKFKGVFDLIVVDAPCSGEGLFRKDNKAINEWSKESVELCALRQRRILKDVWPSLKHNGVLIYSTCTYNSAEDEDTMDWISETGKSEFIQLPIKPEWGIIETTFKNTIGYKFYPHKIDGEGFFISALRKTEPTEEIRTRLKNHFTTISKDDSEIKKWIINSENFDFINIRGQIGCLPTRHSELIKFLSENLATRQIGTSLAVNKRGKLVPEHSAALSIHLNKKEFINIDLSLQEALQYLRKDPLTAKQSQKGFALATYNNFPLGWLNFVSNRINNLYPSNWRIRMRNQ